ncbi:hypothetical protein EVAR_27840_1 [Eumeta japonica]|uniref:Uncharacterized protein n=1 Tax=Eumeta variegata TaxID=151549 RepID=A0A4C1VJ92_EUMVA|nr:hypothetical protein EVAR_27840_1 [Eumeta japonica]
MEVMNKRRLTKQSYRANVCGGKIGKGRPKKSDADHIDGVLKMSQILNIQNRRAHMKILMDVTTAGGAASGEGCAGVISGMKSLRACKTDNLNLLIPGPRCTVLMDMITRHHFDVAKSILGSEVYRWDILSYCNGLHDYVVTTTCTEKRGLDARRAGAAPRARSIATIATIS